MRALRAPLAARLTVSLLGVLLFVLLPSHVHAAPAVVEPGGGCLRLRAEPSLSAPVIACLDEGEIVEVTGNAVEADGYSWRPVTAQAGAGWAADAYLALAPGASAAATPPVPAGPSALAAPPPGGLTTGIAGTASMADFIAAQPFEVASIAVFDLDRQRTFGYLPSAPDFVNAAAAEALTAASVVLVKRVGVMAPLDDPVGATGSVLPEGVPYVLPAPPRGGVTAGLAGTNDPVTLIAAQTFAIESLSAFDAGTQRWLVYLPAAPPFVNTLATGRLAPGQVVFARRSFTAPDPTPPAAPAPDKASTTSVTITYYYCTQGADPRGIGDGGGFCGAMASGATVYAGAASCAAERLGERFRISGDPTGRTYTCEDTGGAVVGDHRDIWFENSDDGYAWWLAVGPTATIEIIE